MPAAQLLAGITNTISEYWIVKERYLLAENCSFIVPTQVISNQFKLKEHLERVSTNILSQTEKKINIEGREEELNRIYKAKWFTQAPLIIAAVGVPAGNWIRKDGKNYNDLDVGIVMDHLVLAAANAGLGTCWIGAFDPDAAREVLGLPDDVESIVFTPLGYLADKPSTKRRKPLSDLVRYER